MPYVFLFSVANFVARLQNYAKLDKSSKFANTILTVIHVQRVIIVKHGDIRLETEMFEDLENYMKMNTYLESSDPWFWPKLRCVTRQNKNRGKHILCVCSNLFDLCPPL